MTDLPTKAREAALSCEAKKHAYRQTQDGVVVSFVLHPQEVPDALAVAPLGARYLLALVELNDDETPKGGDANPNANSVRRNNTPPASVSSPPKPARAHRSWHDMTPAAQAGVLCGDMSFQKFLGVTNPAYAALEVRNRCHITSRADLNRNIDAATIWRGLVSDYRAFMREPEVIG